MHHFGPRNPRMSPPPFGPRFGNSPGNPFMGVPPQMRQRPGGGGLLSKLFGGRLNRNPSQVPSGFRGFGPTAATQGGGGSLIKSLTNPGSINSFLTNTQKVLNTAQQVGPLVQQYGPIVKNLPSMWKLYRGLKDAPEFKKESKTSNETENTSEVNKKSNIEVNTKEEHSSSSTNRAPSPSKPKLYV